MCGINVILKRDGSKVEAEDLRRMSAAIAHRGPDEAGFALLANGAVGFSHVRLSVVDLRSGQQPMSTDDGAVTIVYNGEIYDAARLRSELVSRGHVFQTNCDTEVILRLYIEHGAQALSHLNGEFAFAIWDARVRRLFAARDRSGIKPLYYHFRDDELIFTSEVKALFALPRVERKLSADFLTGPYFGIFSESLSSFEGVYSIKPGHYMEADFGRVFERPYWVQQYEPDESMSFEDALDGIRSRFSNAVRRRLVADVEVGAYLSGGVDSTLVCAMAAHNNSSVTAYNVAFDDPEYDESSLARRIAGFYNARFESIVCSMDSLAEQFEKTIYHVEAPITNLHAVAKQMLSGLVHSSRNKVCLTGEGADEVFGGYPYFKLEWIWRLMLEGGDNGRHAHALWARFKKLERRSEGIMWNRKNTWKSTPRTFGYPCFHQIRAREFGGLIPWMFRKEALAGARAQDPLAHLLQNFDETAMRDLHPFNAARRLTLSQLCGYVIPVLGDKADMANSIETRTPFLDRDLLEFSGTIPPRYFIDIARLREKLLLHEAFRNDLPSFMYTEHKHPFLAPDWRRLAETPRGRELYAEYLSDERINRAQIFNLAFVRVWRKLWTLLPRDSAAAKRCNLMIGMMLGMQALDEQLLRRPIRVDPNFAHVDRTPRSIATGAAIACSGSSGACR